jgi:hypothetical protein
VFGEGVGAFRYAELFANALNGGEQGSGWKHSGIAWDIRIGDRVEFDSAFAVWDSRNGFGDGGGSGGASGTQGTYNSYYDTFLPWNLFRQGAAGGGAVDIRAGGMRFINGAVDVRGGSGYWAASWWERWRIK